MEMRSFTMQTYHQVRRAGGGDKRTLPAPERRNVTGLGEPVAIVKCHRSCSDGELNLFVDADSYLGAG